MLPHLRQGPSTALPPQSLPSPCEQPPSHAHPSQLDHGKIMEILRAAAARGFVSSAGSGASRPSSAGNVSDSGSLGLLPLGAEDVAGIGAFTLLDGSTPCPLDSHPPHEQPSATSVAGLGLAHLGVALQPGGVQTPGDGVLPPTHYMGMQL